MANVAGLREHDPLLRAHLRRIRDWALQYAYDENHPEDGFEEDKEIPWRYAVSALELMKVADG